MPRSLPSPPIPFFLQSNGQVSPSEGEKRRLGGRMWVSCCNKKLISLLAHYCGLWLLGPYKWKSNAALHHPFGIQLIARADTASLKTPPYVHVSAALVCISLWCMCDSLMYTGKWRFVCMLHYSVYAAWLYTSDIVPSWKRSSSGGERFYWALLFRSLRQVWSCTVTRSWTLLTPERRRSFPLLHYGKFEIRAWITKLSLSSLRLKLLLPWPLQYGAASDERHLVDTSQEFQTSNLHLIFLLELFNVSPLKRNPEQPLAQTAQTRRFK